MTLHPGVVWGLEAPKGVFLGDQGALRLLTGRLTDPLGASHLLCLLPRLPRDVNLTLGDGL